MVIFFSLYFSYIFFADCAIKYSTTLSQNQCSGCFTPSLLLNIFVYTLYSKTLFVCLFVGIYMYMLQWKQRIIKFRSISNVGFCRWFGSMLNKFSTAPLQNIYGGWSQFMLDERITRIAWKWHDWHSPQSDSHTYINKRPLFLIQFNEFEWYPLYSPTHNAINCELLLMLQTEIAWKLFRIVT